MSKSYKKAVTIGVAAFSAVALLTTGAAAFVLTNEATKDTTGNINVGTVVDKGLEISITPPEKGYFMLDADTTDSTGRVQYSKEGEQTPNMHVDIAGTITKGADINWSDVALTFTFTVLDAEGKVDKSTEFKKYVTTDTGATEYEYLTLTYTDTKAGTPDNTAKKACPVGGEGTPLTVSDTDGTFDLDLVLNWGSVFGNINPSLYYDAAGASTSFSDVKTALNNLYSLNGLKFKVTLEATLNTVGE